MREWTSKLLILLMLASVGCGYMFANNLVVERKLKAELVLADNVALRAAEKVRIAAVNANKYMEPFNAEHAKANEDLNAIVSRVFEAAGIPEEEKSLYAFDAEFNLVKQEEPEEDESN